MKIMMHGVSDQLNKFQPVFGFGESARKERDEWIDRHQEYRGGERYEPDDKEYEIQFMWDMTDDEFKALMTPQDEDTPEDLRDYLGAVFFGDFKLEFIQTENYPYCNCFEYGANNNFGGCGAYAYLEDGTPYDERLDISDAIRFIKRRTFEHFAKNIEEQVINLINNAPNYIRKAIKQTDPIKWYPDGQCNVKRDITRMA